MNLILNKKWIIHVHDKILSADVVANVMTLRIHELDFDQKVDYTC